GAETEVEQLERAGEDRYVADPRGKAAELADAAIERLLVSEVLHAAVAAGGIGVRNHARGPVNANLRPRRRALGYRPLFLSVSGDPAYRPEWDVAVYLDVNQRTESPRGGEPLAVRSVLISMGFEMARVALVT